MNDQILFYIVIPIYNGEQYIKNCLDSIYKQTYKNYKIVLVDDGSVDDSLSLCEYYANEDSRITVLHQENMGQLASRDAAVKYIVNQKRDYEKAYLIFVDVDDQLKPDALFDIHNAIISYDCDIIVFGFERIKEGIILKEYRSSNHYSGYVDNKRLLYKIILGNNNYNSMCTKSISIDLYKNEDYSEFYTVRHGEDLVQSLYFFRNSNNVYFLNKSLYLYTVNCNSVSNNVDYTNFDTDSKVRAFVWNFIKEENVWTDNDYIEYTTFCQKLLLRKIKTIVNFNIPSNNKYKMFDKMNDNLYYKQILSKIKLRNLILVLFKQRKYSLLCILIRLVSKPIEMIRKK